MMPTICDFCSSPDVRWAFPARDFRKDDSYIVAGVKASGEVAVKGIDVDYGSQGGWTACPACKALIDRGDRDRLARRSAKRLLRMPDAPNMSLRNATQMIRSLHDDFWKNREGRPVPTTPNSEDPT